MRKMSVVFTVAFVVSILFVPKGFSGTCTIISPTNCVSGVCTARVSNRYPSFATVTLSSAFQATCSPTGTFSIPSSGTQLFRGTKTGAATAPVCSWNCTGTTIRFDVNDGLPVELMTFSIDEE